MYNRSVICRIANNLRKKGYTLSAAFRAAWRLAKSKAAVKVAGVSKYNRQLLIISAAMPLNVCRSPYKERAATHTI